MVRGYAGGETFLASVRVESSSFNLDANGTYVSRLLLKAESRANEAYEFANVPRAFLRLTRTK